ncbi:AFR555Wp [Eremothecium gossypii ATCC 10895]|uniref:AFR555Wp n=1 Tax=Eremothecium gossypii (strain ATCC 10895 / CBS 109.51 / FGSC 9923 / NRRL Y-1056) TaxID=284811 RepID=Q752L9_EREGS|nr:AFR555Wp [Eremothecium gossypii ATCC 10895]AAS53926.1 AFR555Wp [Eremothecium gossypii ATCC 10895]AEY98239.1 FAFR555Wp [Eremothecium gossypii FDAG1]
MSLLQLLRERLARAWSGTDRLTTLSRQDVARLLTHPDVLLVDVREPPEYAANRIPGARNVPFRSCPDAWALEPDAFRSAFGFAKPPPSQMLVLYCKSGARASASAERALLAGYSDVSTYPGSMDDWLAHEDQQTPAAGQDEGPRQH